MDSSIRDTELFIDPQKSTVTIVQTIDFHQQIYLALPAIVIALSLKKNSFIKLQSYTKKIPLFKAALYRIKTASYLRIVKFHLYPKFKIAFDPNKLLLEFRGLNSTEPIQYPFFPAGNEDCAYK